MKNLHQSVIYPLDRNLKRRWFVKYVTNGKKRKKIIPLFGTEKERIDFANDFLKSLNKHDNTIKKHKVIYIRYLYTHLESIKIRIADSSYQCYKSHVKSLSDFCESRNYTTLSEQVVNDYIEFLTNSVSNAYINNRISTIKGFFEDIKGKKLIRKNPFSEFKKLKEHVQGKRAFSLVQLEQIKNYIKINTGYSNLMLPILIQYYCFIRPKELRFLQIKHIDFDNSKIFIPSTISKNKKSQHVTIPSPLLEYFLSIELYKYPSEFYIVGKGAKTHEKQCGKNYLQSKIRPILIELNIDTTLYSQYSLKHTGNVRLYKSGVKIKDIQLHNRHSSLQMTDVYLRSLGLEELTDIKNNFPTF